MLSAQIVSALALTCYTILIVLTMRQYRRRGVNRAFVHYLTAMAFWQFSAFMISWHESASRALFWYRLMTAGLVGQFIFYAFFVMVFLDGKIRRDLLYLGWTVVIALIASSSTDLVIESVEKSNVTTLFVPHFGSLVPLVGVIAIFYLGFSIYRLVQRYRRTRSVAQRERIKYLLIGSGVIALGIFSNLAPTLQAYPVDVTANVINAVIIAYAIGRHQLLDIRLVVRKGLLYSIPSIIIGASYFLVISLAIVVFHASSDAQIILSLIVAIVTALVAEPIRNRAQNWLDRFFFREKYDASLMLERLSRTATHVLDLDKLTNLILDEVINIIHISRAAFFLRQNETGEFQLRSQRGLDENSAYRFRNDHPVVEWLRNNDYALTKLDLDMLPQFKAMWYQERVQLEDLGAELFIPIKVKEELVGIFVLGSKLSEQSYSYDDQLTLTTLANQIAVSIENAHIYWQLERTLEALKSAHDELEERVKERTADLARINYTLQDEIKEREKAEAVIHQYTKELERSNRELQQFAYVASHDLQEPLRMVSSYLQLLERRYKDKLDCSAKEYIDFAVDGARRMQTLINDLLQYSRVGTHGKPFSEVSLDEAVDQVQNNLKVAIEEEHATISRNGLPIVYGDGTQLVQLFQNLIANAIKFHGGRPPAIQIHNQRIDGMWQISVSDNGIGIEPQYSDRIFMIFQRLHTRDEYPGNGIGLAICKRIIERHGGKIWVESSQDEGSTFTFTLPVYEGKQHEH